MNKAIITVVGQDTVGIIARVCTYLSQHNVNVLDISQTIIDGYFNMMMIVDYANADKDFGAMVGNLEDLGDDIGVRIRWLPGSADLEIIPPERLDLSAMDLDAARRTRTIIMFFAPRLA